MVNSVYILQTLKDKKERSSAFGKFELVFVASSAEFYFLPVEIMPYN